MDVESSLEFFQAVRDPVNGSVSWYFSLVGGNVKKCAEGVPANVDGSNSHESCVDGFTLFHFWCEFTQESDGPALSCPWCPRHEEQW